MEKELKKTRAVFDNTFWAIVLWSPSSVGALPDVYSYRHLMALVVKSATKLVKVMKTLLNLCDYSQFLNFQPNGKTLNFPTTVAFLSFSIVSHS